MQNTHKNHKSIKKLWRNSLFFLLFVMVSACDIFCGAALDCDSCIEADDFGEFQNQVLVVKAKAGDGSCSFSSSAPLDDPTQGRGLKACLTQNQTNIVVSESPVVEFDSDIGCLGFTAENGTKTVERLCISKCIQDCQLSNLATQVSSEPFWEQTSRAFKISPNSEISIIATGAINLAEDVSFGPFFAVPDKFLFHSKDNGANNTIVDMKPGGEYAITLDGLWKDAIDNGNAAEKSVGPGALNYSNITDPLERAQIHNGLKRLVAYVDPHPEGYKHDASQPTEKFATKGMPFQVDSGLWQCDYNDSDTTKLQSFCSSKQYDTASGYPNINTDLGAGGVDTTPYLITSAGKASNLGDVGGMIRWDGDSLRSYDDNPFDKGGSMISCIDSSGNCDYGVGVDYKEGMIGKSLKNSTSGSNDHIYVNVNDYPVVVSFINLGTNTCNSADAMSVKHFSKNGVGIYPGRDGRIDIENSWSEDENVFYVEKDDKLHMFDVGYDSYPGVVFKNDSGGVINATPVSGFDISTATTSTVVANANSSDGINIDSGDLGYFAISTPPPTTPSSTIIAYGVTLTSAGLTFFQDHSGLSVADVMNGVTTGSDCAKGYAYRADPVREIKITKSGLVKFTMLGEADASGSCKLRMRIMNPNGSRVAFSGLEQDFYEYGDADQGTDHPTNEVSVPVSKIDVSGSATPVASVYNWSSPDAVFVRKGQVIRFDPRSWDGSWSVKAAGLPSKDRKCGIGMAMKIEPRLALLCRGNKTEKIPDPKCRKIGSTDTCQAWDPACEDKNSSTSYCPRNDIYNPAITANKVNCQESDSVKYNDIASQCDMAANNGVPEVNFSSCSSCAGLAASNAANRTPLMDLDLDQCYDLEVYKGKVGNISKITGFTDAQFGDANITKGAKMLTSFDGSYGNFQDFSVKGSLASGNVAYRLKGDATMAYAGRLKFLVLDGASFNRDSATIPAVISGYDSYSANNSGTSFNNDNGFTISLSGSEQFFNGAMLEVRLCKDEFTKDANGNDTEDYEQKCVGKNVPALTSQPYIVEIDDAAVNSEENTSHEGYYKFNEFGRLERIANSSASSAAPAPTAIAKFTYDVDDTSTPNIDESLNKITTVDDPATADVDESLGGNFTSVGSNFYVHNHSNKIDNLRLSFKIQDSDVGNCNIALPPANNSTPEDCSAGCDGIIRTNGFYDKDVLTNVNTFCAKTDTVGLGSSDCKKEFQCKDKYANNSGSYSVLIRIKDTSGADISSVVESVITPVVELLDGTKEGVVPKKVGQAERVYTAVVNDPTFKAMIQIVFILSITFFGIGYLMGMSQFSQGEVISKVVKIGLIYLFIGADGWFWFDRIFVSFFKEGTDYLAFLMATSFDNSPQIQEALANNEFHDKSILFSSIDNVFGIFFSDAAQKKIAALLFASIFGWAYLYIIYMSFLLYVYAVANAVLLYLTSQVFISILFVLGPIFFLFLFFNQTKEMFDKWLSQLISFSLQQIFLLTTLAFFNAMMYEILKLALGYRICWGDILVINTPIRMKLLSFWTIATLPPRINGADVGNVRVNPGIPSIFSILFIWVVASLMKQFIAFMTDLAATIGGGVRASAMASGVAQVAKMGEKFAGAVGRAAWNKTGGAVVDRVDKAVFNSGKTADKERAQTKAQNKTDKSNKRAMNKAGNKAMSNYKSGKDAAKFSAMSPEDKEKTLKFERNKGMIAQGKKLGLSKDASKALMNDNSMKYTGENVIGAAFAFATKGKKPNDKKVNTQFSRNEFRAAARSTDSAGRDKLVSAVKSGDISVKEKKTQRAANAVRAIAKAPKNMAKAAKSAAKGVSDSAGRKADAVRSLGGNKEAKARRAQYKEGKSAAQEAKPKRAKNTAIQQLVNEGAIDDMKRGTGFARSDEEKKAIRNRMTENKAASSKVSKGKNSSDVVSFAMNQKTIGDELQRGQGGAHTRKEGSIAAKVLGREKGIVKRHISSAGAVKARNTNLADAKNHVAAGGAANYTHLNDLQAQQNAFKGKVESANNSLRAHTANIEGDGANNKGLKNASKLVERREKRAELANATSLEGQKAARRDIIELQKTDEYKAQVGALQNAQTSASAAQRESQLAQEGANSIGNIIESESKNSPEWKPHDNVAQYSSEGVPTDQQLASVTPDGTEKLDKSAKASGGGYVPDDDDDSSSSGGDGQQYGEHGIDDDNADGEADNKQRRHDEMHGNKE